jgi:hypothetical protein
LAWEETHLIFAIKRDFFSACESEIHSLEEIGFFDTATAMPPDAQQRLTRRSQKYADVACRSALSLKCKSDAKMEVAT